MATSSIIGEGLRWQVGNGRSIPIWHDRWLPTPSTYKVISPPSLIQDDSRVYDLLDSNTGSWKSELIRSIFLPHEADVITSIALSSHLPDDRLVWALIANGRFSIRSAYKVAMEMVDRELKGAISNDSQSRKF